ncbi:ABC transporter permease [Schaedlerella arabinosiphila]|uniref:ABC transporter permease n=1 Tax=Schaedlerella arabinosiphila TaxID=2044587 RepID=A0A9X5H805_9FIRM|nr:ABC transporter permease [Schaedlerella arabinosiphila]NDO71199.1 ABC transporter permease [Schaedlerella arabinosiphila]
MHHYLCDIARKGLKGKKRSSLYLFLVCFLSVAFAVVNVSITGSLNKTREELRYDTYGEWDAAIYSPEPLSVSKDEHIQDCGTAQVYGKLLDGGETVLTGIGTLDESLLAIGHLAVQSGKFPTEDNEIAIEADILSGLGYDYELGQTLTLRILNREEEVVDRKYTLCGVLREYTDLWSTGTEKVTLAGACVTADAAKEIGEVCSYQYFLSAEGEEGYPLYKELKGSYAHVVENTAANGQIAEEEYHYFNLVLILFTTLVAVIVIYSIQIKEQTRSIRLFRIIGVTKKQLSQIIFYETMVILLPAAAGGVAVGSLATWGLLRVLMEQSTGGFYIAIPAVLIAGILMLWFGAVFGTRFLIFYYALRGRLSAQERFLLRADRRQRKQKQLGLLILSSASVLAALFCYGESLAPVYIDDTWSKMSSYGITKGEQNDYISDKYIENVKCFPGIEEVVAWRNLAVTLEFPDMEKNPFRALLAQNFYGPRPWEGAEDSYGENMSAAGSEGLWCYVYGVAEDNWDQFFRYVDAEIDREKFRNGEVVLLYIPYNQETGVDLAGRLYQDFGVEPGDVITAVNYGLGELSEDGTGQVCTEDGAKPYEPYEKLTAVSRAEAEVAGIITADLFQDPYLMIPATNYYSIIASDAFAKRLTETDKDGIHLIDGSWSNQEYGYSHASVYTGMDAEYLSTDYLMAKSAADNHLNFDNSRERNTALRQEAIQSLLHIWICGIGIFLILMLIQLNIETLRGLTQKRSFALLQVIGMSRRRLRVQLAAKGLLMSVYSCLLGHLGYALYFVIKHIGTYHRYVEEFEYTDSFIQLLKLQLNEYLTVGWSLPMHLAFCAFGMACVFLLFFCPQNRVLKENIRESLS